MGKKMNLFEVLNLKKIVTRMEWSKMHNHQDNLNMKARMAQEKAQIVFKESNTILYVVMKIQKVTVNKKENIERRESIKWEDKR